MITSRTLLFFTDLKQKYICFLKRYSEHIEAMPCSELKEKEREKKSMVYIYLVLRLGCLIN